MFDWKVHLEATSEIEYNNHAYQIIVTKVRDSYAIVMHEDKQSVLSENINNEAFKKRVKNNAEIDAQIIEWGNNVLKNQLHICDKCQNEKLLLDLKKYDLVKTEFLGLKRICKRCRDSIYDTIMSAIDAQTNNEKNKFRDKLKAESPIIIGGFKKRIDAYKHIISIKKNSIESIDSAFVSAKAILTAKDGTYYPVFCVIDTSSGGELWDSQFITKNYDDYIPQDLIFPYIGKNEDQIFPYAYETLSVIEEDFHQGSWFGNITQSNIKHHLSNQIEESWPAEIKSLEDKKLVTVRTYFSLQHILSTAIFLKEIRTCEDLLDNEYTEEVFVKHRAFCVNSIFSAVAFLEASINELFMDSTDNRLSSIRDLSDDEVEILANMWNLKIPRTANYSILEKYQIALTLLRRDDLVLGLDPVQSVSIIIKLRNSLTHYEPEWVTTQSADEVLMKMQKMEKYLKHRFEVNRFTGKDNPFFPDKCLSSGLIEWALKNIIDFTDDFYIEIGLIPPYEKIRYKLESILAQRDRVRS